MSAQADAMAAATSARGVRPLYWSIRRELWEHRAVWVGPLVAGGVFLIGFMVSLGRLPQRMAVLHGMSPQEAHNALSVPYDMAAGLMMLTQMLIGVFYCLDAFQSERRDRSILFWKSMPVSDRTAVLAKSSVPFVILPALCIGTTAVMFLFISVFTRIALAASGQNAGLSGEHVSAVEIFWLVAYHIITVHTLWQAPIYGWLLFVSAWAKRAAYLWAFLPILTAAFLEKIVVGSTHLGSFLMYRLAGGTESAIAPPGRMPIDTMTHLTPWNFLTSPGLWVGLALTAAFLASAMRVRRNREPN